MYIYRLFFFSLHVIISSVAESAGLTLPVSVNPFMIAASLLIILVTYWISMSLSKRKLGKVSLQEVLKKQE
ncbi:hypothetical protein [Metabacillus sp. RGM 3146]|uniref:hypothetical protein n=1 Tax=Metabacillus sp. RGM 3146 TaxID=3401092 RepID=UPI003B9A8B5A